MSGLHFVIFSRDGGNDENATCSAILLHVIAGYIFSKRQASQTP